MNNQNTSEIESSEILLKLADVMRQTSLGHTFIYKSMHNGTFPKQLKIAKKCVRWNQSEISQWIKKQSDLGSN